MQTKQQVIRDGFHEALENVLNGLMEGGSHLKLILCVFRNCCNCAGIALCQKVEFLHHCAGLPRQIPDITDKILDGASKFTDSWYMSCFVDIMDLFTLSLSFFVNKSVCSMIPQQQIDVKQCFKSFLGCLKFPFSTSNDKQQKLRMSTVKSINALVHTNFNKKTNVAQCIEKNSLFELLTLKALAKLYPTQSTIYSVITGMLLVWNCNTRASSHQNDNSIEQHQIRATDIVQFLMHGPGKTLLETIINDINQYQNLESVLLLVNTLMPSEILLTYLIKKITNLSTLLTNTTCDTSKEQVLRFLLYARTSSFIKTENRYMIYIIYYY